MDSTLQIVNLIIHNLWLAESEDSNPQMGGGGILWDWMTLVSSVGPGTSVGSGIICGSPMEIPRDDLIFKTVFFQE